MGDSDFDTDRTELRLNIPKPRARQKAFSEIEKGLKHVKTLLDKPRRVFTL